MTLFQVKSLDSRQHQPASLAKAAFVGYVLLRPSEEKVEIEA